MQGRVWDSIHSLKNLELMFIGAFITLLYCYDIVLFLKERLRLRVLYIFSRAGERSVSSKKGSPRDFGAKMLWFPRVGCGPPEGL